MSASHPHEGNAPSDRRNRPMRDLRISVTDRCNFRCPYCMPAETYGASYRFLPRRALLTFEELQRLTRLFVAVGVGKVRITGGEPLLRADLPELVAKLAAVEGVRDVALTTNGVLLSQHAAALAEAGLHRVTISLDSLEAEAFAALSGGRGLPEDVMKGIAAAEDAGLTPIKINCVVVRGVNDHTAVDLARRFRGTGHVVRFIEFMDVGTLNQWRLEKVVPATEILARLTAEFPLRPAEPQYPGEVARRFVYEDGQGEIGLIASVTMPFCGACTRARLTTEGQLFTCLFGESGTDLRLPLRQGADDEALLRILRTAWRDRDDRYSELRQPDGVEGQRIEMFRMGG